MNNFASPVSPMPSVSSTKKLLSFRDTSNRHPSLMKMILPSANKNGNLPNSVQGDHQAILSAFQQNSNDEDIFIPKENTKKISEKAKTYLTNKKPTRVASKPKTLTKNRQTFSQEIFKTIDRFKLEEKEETKKDICKLQEEKPPIQKEPSVTAKVCKICFEDTETVKTGRLITPCKCAGSMRYIHEECLKTWLVSQQIHLPTASCEICHKTYKMEFSYGMKFYWRQAYKEGLLSLILSIFLIFMIVGVIVMIILFFNKMNSSGDPNSPDANRQISNTYKLAIMISCGFINAVLFILLIFSLKEAFFIKAVKKWTIHQYRQKIKEKKKIEKNILSKGHNKTFQMRFKSQSVNNLFFHSLFKLAPPKPKPFTKFDVSAHIVKISKSFTSANLLQKAGTEEKILKSVNSTGLLLQKNNDRKKVQTVHIKKNNFVGKGTQSPNFPKDHDKINHNKNNFGGNVTLEPIHYFKNNVQSGFQEKELNQRNGKEAEEWQNIMSFKSLDEPFNVVNDGFMEKIGEEFKSFDENEERFLDVILHFQQRRVDN